MRLICLLLFVSCTAKISRQENSAINTVAAKYLKLALFIGKYDGDFVDAYYGPSAYKPQSAAVTFNKDSVVKEINGLQKEIKCIAEKSKDPLTRKRGQWLQQQLTAFKERVDIFSGITNDFDTECTRLFGIAPPQRDTNYFKGVVAEIERLVPGNGDLKSRLKVLSEKFAIPSNKIDTVFRAAIAEARKRTLQHYQLPPDETFTLEYVRNKPWSGYNWYKGNFNSLIEINTDGKVQIERAIDLACHEGYPGHHVYNMLLEENLYKKKGWLEISLYPLFSPQSLIAEGSANYGIELAFPGKEKNRFIKDVLLPLAGIDTAGLDIYMQSLALNSKLNYLRNEVARLLLSKKISEEQAASILERIGLSGPESAKKSIAFIRKYRSYVINYNYGKDLVGAYIEKGNADNNERWKRFYFLLSNPVLIIDLTGK